MKGVIVMAFDPKTIEFIQYKGKKFPLNGADFNEVLELLEIPKTAKVEIVGNAVIVTRKR
jgi:hypothetical protein